MVVLIDINHIPQLNYYKRLILQLSEAGHYVYVTVLKRGRLPKIAQYELNAINNVSVVPLGKHRMSKISAILESNLARIIIILFWSFGKHIDCVISNGFIAHMVGWIHRVPCYAFGDDPQTFDYRPKLFFCDRSHYCIYESDRTLSPKAIILKCTKEWAYLAPKYFNPNPQVLEKYGIKPKEYVFLREVSVGTVNYAGQASGAILGIQNHIPSDKKVLFSLEEKGKRHLYPKDWILLQEPIEDIHSLIYYSAGLVSSGDSMAREAALLGVPSYYLGIRYDMPANAAAAKVANLQNQKTADFADWAKKLSITPEEAEKQQIALREHIDNEFIDINEYMMGLVENVREKNNK
jgi:predicted glycosyltransferase